MARPKGELRTTIEKMLEKNDEKEIREKLYYEMMYEYLKENDPLEASVDELSLGRKRARARIRKTIFEIKRANGISTNL